MPDLKCAVLHHTIEIMQKDQYMLWMNARFRMCGSPPLHNDTETHWDIW